MLRSLAALVPVLVLIAASSRAAEPILLPNQLECGVYALKGRFAESKGFDVLRIYPATTAELELPVFGISATEGIALDGVYVTAELEIFRTHAADAPRARFHKIIAKTNRHDVLKDSVRLLERQPCR